MNTELVTAIISIIAALAGGSISVAFEIMVRFLKKKKQEDESKEDIAGKIKSIFASLSKSAADLVDMQEQLRERIAFVEDLSAKAKQAEEIASLNKEQVDAINQILGDNLQKEGRRGFWKSVLVNFIFFIMGATASYFISVYLL